MESLKPILLLMVLGGVGYGVYVALNHAPPPEPVPAGAALTSSAPDASWNNSATSATAPTAATDPAAAPATAAATQPQAGGLGSLPFGIGAGATPATSTSPQATESQPQAVGQASAPAADTGWQQPPAADPFAPPAASAGGAPPQSGMPPMSAPATADAPSVDNTAAPYSAAPPSATSDTSAQSQARHDFETAMRAAQTELNQGRLVDALRELSSWYDNPVVSPDEQLQMVDLLGQLAGTVIYSRKSYLGPPYVVRAGESLETIAHDCQVPWQLLAKINGLNGPDGLIPGQELKIIRGPFQAQLNAKGQWLALFVDGLYAGRFRVQCDTPLNKPDGSYPVVKFPGVVAQGQAATANRYISLGGDLHMLVSTDPAPPGQPVVRISPQDMGDVYDILSERSEVMIRR